MFCRFSSVNDGTIFGASSDGTISCTDLETGLSESLMDLNPNGWNVCRSLIDSPSSLIAYALILSC